MAIDRREDAGEFYPGGKVISTRPVAGGGDMKHEDFADVAAVPSRFTDTTLRDKLNEVIGLLKGPSAAVALLLGWTALGAGVTVQTAPKGEIYNDEAIVTNVVFDSTGLASEEEIGSIRVELGSNRVEIASISNSVSTLGAAVATNSADIATLTDTTQTLNDTKLSRAEAEAGFTEWVVTPPTYNGSKLTVYWNEEQHFWELHNESGINVVTPIDGQSGYETNIVWDDGEPLFFTATRTRFPTMADLDAKASTNDVQLTPVYSDTPTFSEWTILRDGVDVTAQVEQPEYTIEWDVSESIVSGDQSSSDITSSQDATTISWTAEYTGPDDMETAHYTATRTRTDIIGYQLGSQSDKPLQPKGDYATIDDIPDVSDFATREEVEPAITAYPRVYSFILGATNANFVVTNYQLTAEADAERMHFDPADTDLDFSTVPSSLRLEDASTGTNRVVVDSRDWTVWYYAQKIGKAIHTASTNAIETCRAWVNFTATGEENPIDDTLVIDVPNIWLMAGKTFEKHVASSNSCWVIRSKDVAVPISDNAQSAGGFLELTDAFGEPYMRFNKTDSYFVDPVTDGVEYDSATGAWLVSYSTTTCPMGGANAVIEGSSTYPGKAILKSEDDPDCPATITWTGSANNWVMHAVPKPVGGVVPPKMFFGAVVEVEGQDYIEYLRPMSIPHLLVDGVKIAPEIPVSHPVGTTIPWKVVQ